MRDDGSGWILQHALQLGVGHLRQTGFRQKTTNAMTISLGREERLSVGGMISLRASL